MSSAASGCCPGSTVDMISLRLWPPFSGGGLSRLTVSSVTKKERNKNKITFRYIVKVNFFVVVGFCLFRFYTHSAFKREK